MTNEKTSIDLQQEARQRIDTTQKRVKELTAAIRQSLSDRQELHAHIDALLQSLSSAETAYVHLIHDSWAGGSIAQVATLHAQEAILLAEASLFETALELLTSD